MHTDTITINISEKIKEEKDAMKRRVSERMLLGREIHSPIVYSPFMRTMIYLFGKTPKQTIYDSKKIPKNKMLHTLQSSMYDLCESRKLPVTVHTIITGENLKFT